MPDRPRTVECEEIYARSSTIDILAPQVFRFHSHKAHAPRYIHVMSGPGAEGGFAYQAQVTAHAIVHLLVGQPLHWFPDIVDIPSAVRAETGGIGDDLRIDLRDGGFIEVQAKRGCDRDTMRPTVLRMLQRLGRDGTARAVLVIDETSSRTIRSRFRDDVKRLAGGKDNDHVSEVGQEIAQLAGVGAGHDIWQRFGVVVLSYPLAGNLTESAASYLREIAAPEQVATAWQQILSDARELIRTRSGRDRLHALKLLGRHVSLRGEAAIDNTLLHSYVRWCKGTYGTFFSVAVGQWLPSTEAWNKVRRLDADDDEDEDERKPLDAHKLIAKHPHVLVVGGAGAGKSTLAVRLCHESSSEDKIAFRGALRDITRRLLHGITFDAALGELMPSVGDVSPARRAPIVEALDLLVADGLDECGPHKALVVQRLTEWSLCHPHCRVVVTSRPYAAEPNPLPGFICAELTPLEIDGAEQIAATVAAHVHAGEVQRAETMRRIHSILPRWSAPDRLGEVARNPLLLSFLVVLAANGLSLSGRLSDIYGRIVDRMAKGQRSDRSTSVAVPESLARFVFNLLGQCFMVAPAASLADLRKQIAPEIASSLRCHLLAAELQFDDAVEFWIEHAVLDRTGVGLDESVVFVHQSLAEYGAGRYAAELDDGALWTWLKQVSNSGSDVSAALFAAGAGAGNRMARYLLSKPDDGYTTDILLAARALYEQHDAEPELIRSTVERLTKRLISPVPIISVEAGIVLRALATIRPEVVGSAVSGLASHEHAWTRLGALAVTLVASPSAVDLADVSRWFDNLDLVPEIYLGEQWANERDLPSKARALQHSSLPLAVRAIATNLTRNEATAALERLLKSPLNPEELRTEIGAVLADCGFHDIYEKNRAQTDSAGYLSRFLEEFEKERPLEENFLRVICSALSIEPTAQAGECQPPLKHLSPFYRVLKIDSLPALLMPAFLDALQESLRGIADACRVDRELLSGEIGQALSFVARKERHSVYSLVRDEDAFTDWTAGARDRSLPLLSKALLHPSDSVKRVSVNLLANADLSEETLYAVVRSAFTEGSSRTLEDAAWLAAVRLPAERAVSLILERLEGRPLRGCGYLFYKAGELFDSCSSEAQSKIRETIIRGLTYSSIEAATDATRALAVIIHDSKPADSDAIRDAYDHWTVGGAVCSRCGTTLKNAACPACHIGYASPRPQLLQLLEARKPLPTTELIALCAEGTMGVADVALQLVTTRMNTDTATIVTVIEALQSGTPEIRIAPGLRLLGAVFRLSPEILAPHYAGLSALLDSQVPQVREHVMRSIETFTTPDVAAKHARHALADASPSVRSAAALAIRRLDGGSGLSPSGTKYLSIRLVGPYH